MPAPELPAAAAAAPPADAAAPLPATRGWSPSKLESLQFFLSSTTSTTTSSAAAATLPPTAAAALTGPAPPSRTTTTAPLAPINPSGQYLDPSRPYVGLKYLLQAGGAGGGGASGGGAAALPVTWLSQVQARRQAQAAPPSGAGAGPAAPAWGSQGGRAPRGAPGHQVARYQPYSLSGPSSR